MITGFQTKLSLYHPFTHFYPYTLIHLSKADKSLRHLHHNQKLTVVCNTVERILQLNIFALLGTDIFAALSNHINALVQLENTSPDCANTQEHDEIKTNVTSPNNFAFRIIRWKVAPVMSIFNWFFDNRLNRFSKNWFIFYDFIKFYFDWSIILKLKNRFYLHVSNK